MQKLSKQDISLIKRIHKLNSKRRNIYSSRSRKYRKVVNALAPTMEYKEALKIANVLVPKIDRSKIQKISQQKHLLVLKLSKSLKSKDLQLNHNDSGFFNSITSKSLSKKFRRTKLKLLDLYPKTLSNNLFNQIQFRILHRQSVLLYKKIQKSSIDIQDILKS